VHKTGSSGLVGGFAPRARVAAPIGDQRYSARPERRVCTRRHRTAPASARTDDPNRSDGRERKPFGISPVSAGSYSVHISARRFFKDVLGQVRVWRHAPPCATQHPARIGGGLLRDLRGVTARFKVTTENRGRIATPPLSARICWRSCRVFDQDYLAVMSRFLDAGSIGSRGYVRRRGRNGGEQPRDHPPPAIREVRINQNPYSAEFFRPGRGRIEIITKRRRCGIPRPPLISSSATQPFNGGAIFAPGHARRSRDAFGRAP